MHILFSVRPRSFVFAVKRLDVSLVERSRNLSVMTFHEKAGWSQGNCLFEVCSSCFFCDKVIPPAEVATVAMLPSALSRSESFRSVYVGRSRFSRCCHLFGDLSFHSRVERGPGD